MIHLRVIKFASSFWTGIMGQSHGHAACLLADMALKYNACDFESAIREPSLSGCVGGVSERKACMTGGACDRICHRVIITGIRWRSSIRSAFELAILRSSTVPRLGGTRMAGPKLRLQLRNTSRENQVSPVDGFSSDQIHVLSRSQGLGRESESRPRRGRLAWTLLARVYA